MSTLDWRKCEPTERPSVKRAEEFAIGDRVEALNTLVEHPSGDSPGGLLCNKGDVLIVRGVPYVKSFWDIYVSHPEITDRTFGVTCSEIKLTAKADDVERGQ